MGTRFGGHALFVKEKKLHYVYNFLGIQPEQHYVSSEELKPGKYVLGMEFIREGAGPNQENVGRMKLYVNDKVAAEGPMKTQLGKFGLGGSGLTVGYSNPDTVSQEYEAPARFQGGAIQFVEVAVDRAQYLDRETELKRALRD
jgi:arylsulfatase